MLVLFAIIHTRFALLLAQVQPGDAPVTPPVDFAALIQSLFTAWNGHAYVLVAALIVGTLVAIAKQGWAGAWLAAHLPSKSLPFVAVILGVLATAAAQIQAGVPWTQALLNGVLAGFAAIAGHQTFIESMRGGKEIVPATKTVVAQAPPQDPPVSPPGSTVIKSAVLSVKPSAPSKPPTAARLGRAIAAAVCVAFVGMVAGTEAGCSAKQWVAFEASAKNLVSFVNLFLPVIETTWSMILPALGANAGDANAAFNKAVVDLSNASAVLVASMNATDAINQPAPDLTKLIQNVKDAVSAITVIVDQYGPNAQAKVPTLGAHLDNVHQMANAIRAWK